MKPAATGKRPSRRRAIVVLAVVLLLSVVPIVALALSGVAPGPGPRSPAPGLNARQSRSNLPGTTPAAPTPATTRPAPLTVVALGDSVPAADTCGCTGYVEQVGAQLQSLTRRPWVVVNDAIGGWTTSDVLDHLHDAAIGQHLAAADLVLLQVGANDFNLDQVGDPGCLPIRSSGCFASTLAELRTELTGVITGIRSTNHHADLRIAVLDYWNVTVDGQVGQALGPDFVTGSDALTGSVNRTIHGVADATRSIYIDTYTPLKGAAGDRDPTPDLLDDGDHPNASGHSIIAATVIAGLERHGLVGDLRAGP